LVKAGTDNSSFAAASEKAADMMDLEVLPKQIERVTERIGWERCAQRDAAVADYMSLPLAQRKDKPAQVTAPEVAVVGVDGGRLQIRDHSDNKSSDNQVSNSDNPASAAVSLPPDENYRGTHWREDKIG
jgi:hypothetical protein